MKILNRFIVVFAIGATLFLILGSAGIVLTAYSNKNLTDLTSQFNSGGKHIEGVKVGIHRIHSEILSLMIADASSKSMDRLEDLVMIFHGELDGLTILDWDEVDALDSFRNSFQNYYGIGKKLVESSGSDDYYALSQTIESLHRERNELFFKFEQIASEFEQKKNKRVALIMGANESFLVFSLCILALSIFLAFLLFISLSKSITKPILELTNTIGSLKLGNFKAKSIRESNDEIGELARAVNNMSYELDLRFAKTSLFQSFLKGILDSVDQAIIAVDEELKITHWNRGAASFFRLTNEQTADLPFGLVVPDKILEQEAISPVIDKGTSVTINNKRVIIKENERYIDIIIFPLVEKHLKGAVILIKDISSRIQDQKASREKDKRYRTLVENMNDGLLRLDMNGQILYANKQLASLAGYDVDELIGSDSQILLIDESYHYLEHLNDKGEPYEIFIKSKDGSIIPTVISPTSLYDDSGNQRGSFMVITDISRIKETEAELRRHRDHLEDLVDKQTERLKVSLNQAESMLTNLPVIFWAIDKEGEFLLSRGQGLKAMGLEQNQVVGVSVFEMYKHYPDIIDNIKKAFEGNEVRYTAKIGELQFETLLMPDKDESGTVNRLNALSIDVSERIKTEAELKEARDAAEQANKAKSEFLANMSHEIRTPMNAILGFSEVLNEKLADNPKFREFIKGINNAGKNLLALINDILDLSKIEAGKMEMQRVPIDPAALLEEIRQIFSLKARDKGISLIVSIDPDRNDKVMLDETRIRQILFNLVGNAVKFTDEGNVVLSYYSILKEDGKLDLLFKVRDSGRGIGEEDIKLIFEPFKQQRKQDSRIYKGTGLGLSITKRLVDIMDGRITAESTEGKGSSFTVLIPGVEPVSPEALKDDDSVQTYASNIRFKESTILLVEDMKSNRDVVKAYLDDMGLYIVEAENGEKGIEAALYEIPDLILMDLAMPVLDGYEAAERIKSNGLTSQIPIVAFTASAMSDQKEMILEYCDAYLAKPASKVELLNMLMTYLPYVTISEDANDIPETIPEDKLLLRQISSRAEDNSDLRLLIKNEILPLFLIIEGTYPMDETELFASEIIKAGTELSIAELISYGKLLNAALETMDFDNIERLVSLWGDLMDSSLIN